MLNTIDEGIKAVRQGKIVIVVDDENRENEGDFIVSGEKITPDIVNFMITHGRGLLCVPLPRSRCTAVALQVDRHGERSAQKRSVVFRHRV